jgi:hypothetical protein
MLKEIERLKTELVEPAELRATVAQFLTTTIWLKKPTADRWRPWRCTNWWAAGGDRTSPH